eukprot:818591-Pleurochrysis_carterae.AAC.1
MSNPQSRMSSNMCEQCTLPRTHRCQLKFERNNRCVVDSANTLSLSLRHRSALAGELLVALLLTERSVAIKVYQIWARRKLYSVVAIII